MTRAERAAPTCITRLAAIACDIAGLMLVAIAVLINVEIVTRGLFGASTLIADEYSGYLFAWLTLLGFGHALQDGAFLRVEGLIARFSPRGRAFADTTSALVGLVVAAVCTYATTLLALASYRYDTLSIQPSATPLWMVQVLIPIAFAFLTTLYAALAITGARRVANRLLAA